MWVIIVQQQYGDGVYYLSLLIGEGPVIIIKTNHKSFIHFDNKNFVSLSSHIINKTILFLFQSIFKSEALIHLGLLVLSYRFQIDNADFW